MGRRRRTQPGAKSDLGVLFLDGFGDFVLELLTGLFEFPHAAADAAGEFRKVFGSEEHEHRKEDQHQFWLTQPNQAEER